MKLLPRLSDGSVRQSARGAARCVVNRLRPVTKGVFVGLFYPRVQVDLLRLTELRGSFKLLHHPLVLSRLLSADVFL